MRKIAKKLLLYIGGLLILATGVNIAKTAQLGLSPVTAIPYAMELIWNINLGKATLFFYLILIALQIILLRRNYKPIQILQIVGTFLFGIFVTYTSRDYLLFWLPMPSLYIIKLIYLFISIIVIGTGISLYLIPNFLSLPSEGLLNAIVEYSKGKFEFSNVKVTVDIIMVATSALLSIIFLGGLKSVREGTVIAALCIGRVVGVVFKRYKPAIVEWIEK
ncbi:MAG: DUF6198 family protein [Tissierellia bacterium]|nr:DUF6198 family protein [Tissierellia bacterium]MDD3751910.1 DUF6198 family protein [Tissierellia bacterium]